VLDHQKRPAGKKSSGLFKASKNYRTGAGNTNGEKGKIS